MPALRPLLTIAAFGVAVIAALIIAHTPLLAQVELTPRRSDEGLAVAAAQARLVLADDAALVFIGALGNATFDADGMPVPLRFHPADGSATAWVYAFFSPMKNRRVVLAAVDIPGVGYQAFPTETPVPIPDARTPIDATLPYSGSGAMVGRLAADPVYRAYRAELPGTLPQALAYRALTGADSALLPSTFPLDAPAWAIRFTGAGDSSMLCYVSASTGAVYSLRGGTSSVHDGAAQRGGTRMDLSMNERSMSRWP